MPRADGSSAAKPRPSSDLDAVLAYSPMAVARAQDRMGVWCNQRMTEMFGWTLEELRGRSSRLLYIDDASWLEFGARTAAALRDRGECTLEQRLVHKDGHALQVRAHGRRGSRSGEVIWFFEDVSAQRDAERALADREARLLGYFDSPAVGVVVSEDGAGFVDANPAFCRFLGYRPDELYTMSWKEITAPEDWEASAKARGRLLAGEATSCTFEKRYLHKDGTPRWAHVSVCLVEPGPTGRRRFAAMVQDASAQVKAREALRESEECLRSVFAAMAEGVVVQDATGRIRLCNGAAERILGLTREQMEGRGSVDPRWRAIHDDGSPFPGETHPGMVTLRTGQPLSGVVMGVETPDGARRWIAISSEPLRATPTAAPYGVVATFTDLTELRRGQELLAVAERARVVGQLAGGIAHDYNNLLTTIIANCEFVAESLPAGSQQAEDNATVLQAAQKAAELTRQLLSYGRRQLLRAQDLDAAELVQGLVPLARSVCGPSTEVSVRVPEVPTLMRADRHAVEQSVLNLLLNAHDAMPAGGRLEIGADRVELREGDPALRPHLRPGPFVRVWVTDSGMGIRPEHLPHVFEPFFSTKDPAAGAGLGLASVDGTMEQSGGSVTLSSEPGRGTTVTLFLPAAVGEGSSGEEGRRG